MYTSQSRSVPSNAALKALRQLAYISSGTAVGVATLCTEERRRRTQVVQRIADNAKRLRQSPRYYQNAAVATHEAENELVGVGGIDWLAQYSYPFDQTGQHHGKWRWLVGPEELPIRGPELSSAVQKGYAQVQEQAKKSEEGSARRPSRVRDGGPHKRVSVQRGSRSSPVSATDAASSSAGHQIGSTDDRIVDKGAANRLAITRHGRMNQRQIDQASEQAQPAASRQLARRGERTRVECEIDKPATLNIGVRQALENSHAAAPGPSYGKTLSGSSSQIPDPQCDDSKLRTPQKPELDFDFVSLRDECQALISRKSVSGAVSRLSARKNLAANRVQWKSLMDECFDAALVIGHVPSMDELIRIADKTLLGSDYQPYCAAFLRHCDAKGAYDAVLNLFGRRRVLRQVAVLDLGSDSLEIIAYACTRTNKKDYQIGDRHTAEYFSWVLRRVPAQMRARITDNWIVLPLRAEWRRTRNLPKISKIVGRLRGSVEAAKHNDALRRLDAIALDIYASANAHDRALSTVVSIHTARPNDAFAISVAAMLFAKKGNWDFVNQLLTVAQRSKTLTFDADSIRWFNTTIRLYSSSHSSTETWKFVTRAVDDLGFRPNQATSAIMLQSFISRNTLNLIPKWIRYVRIMGERFRLDAELAAKLLKRYYLEYRPSHVLIMWFCRNLVHFAPSLAGPEYVQLVREAIGFDIKKAEADPITRRRGLDGKTRLDIVEGAYDVVPSPGWKWDNQIHFVHPDEPTDEPLDGLTMPLPEDCELPSSIQIEDLRPLPDEPSMSNDDQTSDEAVESGDMTPQRVTGSLVDKPEGDMVLALSLHRYGKVLDLYRWSLDAEDLPASPFALEIAVEASLRLNKGHTAQADIILRDAKKAGMNITGAMGPMLVHQMQRMSRHDTSGLDRLQESVVEYYRVNDENGWPVKHHVGVTAASILIKHSRPAQCIAILHAMYRSEQASKRPLDAVAMAVFIKGYLILRSAGGLKWAFENVLNQNMRIDRNFLHAVKAAMRRYGMGGKFRYALRGDKDFRPLLVHWIQQCYERRTSQMFEAKVLGRELVACLAKCAKIHDEPIIDVSARSDVEDALFGQRMKPLTLSSCQDRAASKEKTSLHVTDPQRRDRYILRMRERIGQSIRSRYPLRDYGRRPAPLRRYHTRWLRQYRAFLRRDMTMPDGKLAAFRFRLSDDPDGTLASKRRRKAGTYRSVRAEECITYAEAEKTLRA